MYSKKLRAGELSLKMGITRSAATVVPVADYKNNNNKILLITNISNYISFPPQIAYKLIEAGRSKDSLQIQGLSIDGLNNREYTTIQYRD